MDLPTLREVLDATPYPLLLVIALCRNLTVPRNLAKAALVELLRAAYADRAACRAILNALSPEECAVLDDLRLAGGRLPRYHIARRHGDFRDYRPWRDDAPARPWESPISPTERLYFLGLLFWDKTTRDLLIPADLLHRFPARPAPAPSTVLPADALPGVLPAHYDLVQLLAGLEATPPRLVHGQWLPPTFLRAWGDRCAVPPARPDAPGERRTGRRRWLHYLALAGGWVGRAGTTLALTPAGWTWLAAPLATRLTALWAAFAHPAADHWNGDLWRAFRLTGYRDLEPATLVAALLRELARDRPAPGDDLGLPQTIAARLLARDPGLYCAPTSDFFAPEKTLTAHILALLNGPCTWLGALAPLDDGSLVLTSWGTHWLGLAAAPDLAPPPPFHLAADLTFTAPGLHLAPQVLVTLAACAEPLAGETERAAFRVTQATWTRALHRGRTLANLLDTLDAGAQRPLNGAERATLTAWAAETERMTVRRLTVLDVVDPAILSRLHATRRGRRLVTQTLSRRCVAIDEGKLPLLVRRLTQQEGAPPRLDLPPTTPPATSTLGRGGAALLWLTARVYRDLGDVIPLPARLPDELLERLAAEATAEDMAAAEASAARVHAAVQDALQGRAAFPVWTEITLPVTESLALIARALAAGQALAMDYYTAGRDVTSRRIVEPYRIDYRGRVRQDGQQTAYLVGFCHTAQAERVFRVDRIRALEIVALPDTD